MTKKKEDPYVKYASPRDLTTESFRKPDNIYISGTHRIKAECIDAPPTIIAIFPKELPMASFGCMIYNALEKERGSNIVWRVR